jgi:putative transposase
LQAYRALIQHHDESKLLNDIRKFTNKELALGNGRFKADLEAMEGKRSTMRLRSRLVGCRKEQGGGGVN